MKKLAEISDLLLPDDSNPQSVRNYRLWIALIACSAWCYLVFFLTPLIFTGFPRIGGLAWGADIDQKIIQAIEPIHKDLSAIKVTLQEQNGTMIKEKIRNLITQIYDSQVQRCEAIEEHKSVRFWTNRIAELEEEYRQLTNSFLPIPDCREL